MANPNAITGQDVSATCTPTPLESATATALGGPRGAAGHVPNGIKTDPGTGGSRDDPGENCSPGDPSGGWSIEALGQDSFDFGEYFDDAHVQPDGEYHYHGLPEGFIDKRGGDGTSMTLIGWAADGFPIYARHGHSDPDDASSALAWTFRIPCEGRSRRPGTDIPARCGCR